MYMLNVIRLAISVKNIGKRKYNTKFILATLVLSLSRSFSPIKQINQFENTWQIYLHLQF